ncbi:MAG: 2-oxoacid:acceptor oxidoreductase family protein [Pirellulales bacterium]
MLRIRFHGRGGHGVKTASRILGTAGFLASLHAQDAPIYGAERRGAAVAAFTWLSALPIRERGTIARPDLLVIADETLLDDPAAGVLAGAEAARGIFINTDRRELPESLAPHAARVLCDDVTSATRAALGRAQSLSAGLAAVAARMTGIIDVECLVRALHEELSAMGLGAEQQQTNERLVRELFARTSVVQVKHEGDDAMGRLANGSELAAIAYDGPVLGAPSILAPGNASARHTGAWRVDRPVVDASRCTRCGLCFVQCPDGAIALDEHGYPLIDYDHCKGCMICGHVCPVKAIQEERETHAW